MKSLWKLFGLADRRLGWAGWVVFVVVAAGSFLLGAEFGRPLFGTRASRAVAARTNTIVPAPGEEAARGPSTQPGDVVRPLPLPAEFGPQSAVVLGCNELVEFYQDVLVNIVGAIHDKVHVVALVTSELQARRAWKLLRDHNIPTNNVRFVVLPLDSMWVRDYGPLFVRLPDGKVRLVDFTYSPRNLVKEDRLRDEEMPKVMGRLLGLPVDSVAMDLDGGNVLTNGDGLVVTTTALIAENQALGHTISDLAATLRDHLGFTRWVYVRGLEGEPTGHADMFITFLAIDQVVVGRMDPAVDAVNAKILDEAAESLAKVQTSRGPMTVHRIPMPPPVEGRWRTYTNVLLANGVLLMPTFSDADPGMQEEAMALYATLLSGWRVVGVNADSLAKACGLLHCFALNVPDYVPVANFAKGATTQPAGPLPGEGATTGGLLSPVGRMMPGPGLPTKGGTP